MRITIFLFFTAICLVATTGCGTSKKAASGVKGDVEVKLPCSGTEYLSNSEYLRATMPAVSNNMAAAKTMALTLARAELATIVSALVQRVNDTYTRSFTSGEKNDTKVMMEERILMAVKERISGSRLGCEKMMQTPDGQFRYYANVEISCSDLIKGIETKVYEDAKLRLEFDRERFRKIFDEEMSKLQQEP
jgi:hypothetical protein